MVDDFAPSGQTALVGAHQSHNDTGKVKDAEIYNGTPARTVRPIDDKPVPEFRIRRQAVVYYLVLFLWPAYLFFLPLVAKRFGFLSAPFFIFPGIYLFTWVGYLMHESWHKYVPNVNNGFFYNAFSIMLLTDPQLYRMTHGFHHAQVHTPQDAEFHPMGRIRIRFFRILYNWLEFLMGVLFLVLVSSLAVPRDERFMKKYRFWKLPASVACWVVFLGGIGTLSHLAFGVTFPQIAIPWIASFWLDSFILHQSQLIEHGNLYVEGTFSERNIWTRNLKPSGMAEKIFLFFTHGDSQEHVLHHVMPGLYLRPFLGAVPLPEGAQVLTLRGYFRIAGRMLAGREEHVEIKLDPQRA